MANDLSRITNYSCHGTSTVIYLREASSNKLLGAKVDIPSLLYSPNDISLCGGAKIDAKLYVGKREGKRRTIYKEENPKVVKSISKKITVKVLKEDALANSKIMTLTIGIFGGLTALGFIGGPLIGGILTSFGVSLGIASGSFIIHNEINRKVNISINFSDHYAEWRAKAISLNVYPIFKNFIDKDKVFEDFLDPFTNEICSIPMVDPHGKTYDQKPMYNYIQENKYLDDEKFTSPFTGQWICKNDLIVNTQYCRKLIKKCEDVYADVIKQSQDNEIKYGIHAVILHTQSLMESIRSQLAGQLFNYYENDVRSKKMTHEERAEYIRLSTKQWDFRDPL